MFRRIRKNIFALFIGLLFALILSEVLLRIFPTEWTDYNSDFYYRADPVLGYIPEPNQKAQWNQACVKNTQLTTNSLGFRGPEWVKKGSPVIALIGDSYLLGLSVEDSMLVSAKLAELTGADVWNAGVSGYSSYNEYIVWKTLLKERKPDIVIMLMYLRNDIRENYCGLSQPGEVRMSPCAFVESGEVKFNDDFATKHQVNSGFKKWMKKHCMTCRVVQNFRKNSQAKSSGNHNPFLNESYDFNLFLPTAGKNWEDAWTSTEKIITLLKEEANAAGSKFLIVTVPDYLQISNEWQSELSGMVGEKNIPENFDRFYPQNHLTNIAQKAGISVMHLAPLFSEYRDRHQLKKPYFSYCCDGHWSPLGHSLAASFIYQKMAQDNWVPQIHRETAVKMSSLTPKEIVGASIYSAISQCGDSKNEK